MVLGGLFIFLRIEAPKSKDQRLSLRDKVKSLDYAGCLVFIAATCCLLLALQWGGQSKPWHSATIIALLLTFVILAVAFGFIQWRLQDKALIPLRVLSKRSIFTSAMVLFFLGASSYLVMLSCRTIDLRALTDAFRMSSTFRFTSKQSAASAQRQVGSTSSHFCCPRWWR